MYLHGWEADSYKEIRHPVDQYRHRHCRWPGTLKIKIYNDDMRFTEIFFTETKRYLVLIYLTEELCCDHPRDGSGSDREEDNVEQC